TTRIRGSSGSSCRASNTSRRVEGRRRRRPALASAHGGRQLRPRLADRARRGGRPRARGLRAGEPARPARDRGRARRDRARTAPAGASRRTRAAHRVEPRRLAPGRALRGSARRLPLQRLDVPAAARRRPVDDDPRPRAAALPGVGARTDEAHARGEVPARGADLRRRDGQLEIHGRRRRRDARRAARAHPRRLPGGRAVVLAGRAAGGARRPVRADGRDAGAAEESRHAARGIPQPRRARPRGGGRAGLGTAAAARRRRCRAPRLHVSRRPAAPVPRCERRRLPVALRRLRDAGDRGDGVRRARRRFRASVARRGVRRRCRARGSTRRECACRRDPERARAPGRARRARARARPRLHLARERPGASRGMGVRAVKVAMDVTPLRLTRAGTARYVENLRARLDVEPLAFAGRGRASVLARELWWYPFGLASVDADVLHCTTYYGPLRPRVPTVVTVHDLAVLRRPEAFPRWTRTYAP